MAVTIRLSRQGAKKQPNYLVVAVDSEKEARRSLLGKTWAILPKSCKARRQTQS